MEHTVLNNLVELGLGLSLSILIAFKVGKTRGLSLENINAKMHDIAVETVKQELTEKLQACFNLYFNTPEGVNWKPDGFTMKEVMSHLVQGETDNLEHLHSVYTSLATQSLESTPFVQALGLVSGLL